MGSTGDERLNSIRTITKEFVEGALANCPRVGVEVSDILILDRTHGLGLTPNDEAQQRRGTLSGELPKTNRAPLSAATSGSASGSARGARPK